MLDEVARKSLDQNGYVLVPNVQPSDLALTCESLGRVTVDKRSPQPYRRISPQQIELARENTLSSRYGIGSFPFHTDAAHWRQPPRYLVLFCTEPGSGGRETHLIDTRTWEIDDELRLSMRSEIWRMGHREQWLGTLAVENEGEFSVRYDTGCMSPTGPKAERLKIQIESLIDRSSRIRIPWKKNSLLVIRNSRLLHARAAAIAVDTDRILIRALIGGVQ